MANPIHIHLHDDFEESKHPRGEGGKFGAGGKQQQMQRKTPTPELEEEAYQFLIRKGLSESQATLPAEQLYQKASALGWKGKGGYIGGPGSRSKK